MVIVIANGRRVIVDAGVDAAALTGDAITLAFCWAHLRKTVLRYRKGRFSADRERSSRSHRRALCDREDDPRQKRR